MIAKIVSDNREYYSYIFARFNPGWYECIIVFDMENQKFELLNIYKTEPYIKRKVFIVDTEQTDMIEKKEIKISLDTTYTDCLGYHWILENPDLIKKIKNGTDVEETYVKMAESLNHSIDTREWKYVKNQKDAEDLLTAAWGFHDAKIADIHYKISEHYEDPSSIQVLFTGCWDCDILLEFKTDILLHFNVDDGYLMESNILFHDGFIYWVDEFIENTDDITEENIYFRARSLAWKMITHEE